MGSQPNAQQPTAPSAEQMAIAQMAQFAQQPNSLAGILSNLNALTGSRMNPNGPSATNVLLSMPQAQQTSAAAHGGSGLTLGAGSGTGSGTGLSSQRLSSVGSSLGKGAQSLYDLLAGKSIASQLGLTAANSALPALSAAQLMDPVGTGAISAAGNAAGSSAASELASALSGGAPSTLGALTASQLIEPVGTGAISSAANAAGASAAQELANAGYGGGASGASGAASGLAGDATTALGALGAGYGLYNTVNNYQSGATGSDALNGAETGASIGTMFAPGLGTAVGGLLGGAAGALSSAFGGGKNDPETLAWNNVAKQASSNPSVLGSESPSQLYQNLAGMMDAKNNSPGHSTNLELHFGRAGEQSLMDQMTQQVNQALSANPSLKGDSASQLYSSVVEPWLQKSGAYIPSNAIVSSNGTMAGNTVNSLLTNLLGDWMNGSITPQSKLGIAGQTIGGLSPFLNGAASSLAPSSAAGASASPMSNLLAMGSGAARMRAMPWSMR